MMSKKKESKAEKAQRYLELVTVQIDCSGSDGKEWCIRKIKNKMR